jgi:hypothetical protein
MYAQLLDDPPADPTWRITREQYDSWRRHFVFDGLRNLSYGESFCRYFQIRDNVLRFSQTVNEADEYIMRYYLR